MKPEPITYQRAGRLRRAMTAPEARLWRYLRGKALRGLRFRRQHPIGPYIVDFYCAEARLAVEIDGAVHDSAAQTAHDDRRTAWLAEQGVRVIRFRATQIRDEIDYVLALIADAAGDGGG